MSRALLYPISVRPGNHFFLLLANIKNIVVDYGVRFKNTSDPFNYFKVSNSNCAYLLATYVNNVDSSYVDSGSSSSSNMRPSGDASDRSRTGRAAPLSHDISQNDLLNCQLMTSSLRGWNEMDVQLGLVGIE